MMMKYFETSAPSPLGVKRFTAAQEWYKQRQQSTWSRWASSPFSWIALCECILIPSSTSDYHARASRIDSHVRMEARVQMTSALIPVSAPRDTRVSSVSKVSVLSVKLGHPGWIPDIAVKLIQTKNQSIDRSMFYFMSVHSKVILANNNNKTNNKIYITYTSLPTGLWTIDLTTEIIRSVLYKYLLHC